MRGNSTPWEEGNPSSQLLLLGEAPSKNEMRLNQPFVGEAGMVLDQCLHMAQIARRQCYILNVWPFEVKKDFNKNILTQGGIKLWDRNKGLTEEGFDAARPALEKIELSGAHAILAMGSPALDLLMGGHRPITKWRGSPLWSTRVNCKLIPTVHPAYALHSEYVNRYLIVNDMNKIKLELGHKELILPKRNLMIYPTLAQVAHYFHACRKAGRFATDLEVVNMQVSCFSLSVDPSEALTVPLVHKDGTHYWSEEDEIWIWRNYAQLMGDPSLMKINQNIVGFDKVFLLQQNNIHTRGPIGDTMIAQHIVWPEFPKGLDFIAAMHTREPYWKDDGKIWKHVNIDWDKFQRYCALDSAGALECWFALEKELDEGGFRPTYDMTIEMADPLAYMAIDGLPVDRTGLADMSVKLEKLIAEKEKALNELVGGELNANSPKQCCEYFYDKLNLPPYKNREGGRTVDDKALSRIVRRASKGSKEAKVIQEIRRYKKLKSTYIEVETDKDDHIRCSWNPRGTWTGRLSSSKTIAGTGMNLQNLDAEFKGFIVAGKRKCEDVTGQESAADVTRGSSGEGPEPSGDTRLEGISGTRGDHSESCEGSEQRS